VILDEIGDLLKVLAAYDGRNVGESDLMVWGRQMADLDFQDAIEAVHQHYAETAEWAKPSHVRARAEKIRNARNVRPEVIAPGCYEPEPSERRRLAAVHEGPPTLAGVQVQGGVAQCRDVLGAILDRLAAVHSDGEVTESDRVRLRALERARAERKGRRS
jgi:hypothetical protein